jgi:hypothetical protein
MSKRLTTTVPPTLTFAVGAVLGLAATAGIAAFVATEPQGSGRAVVGDTRPTWVEEKWQQPADLWSAGKMFKCRASACGTDLTLYLRAKIGFCNCTAGVADDVELERVADFHLIHGKPAADGPGRPITVAWMKGRSRSYSIADASSPGRSALVIAFNDRCDAIVATVLVRHDRPAVVEDAVIEFLNGDVVLRWAQRTLGL